MYENPMLVSKRNRLQYTLNILKQLDDGTHIEKAAAIIEYNMGVSHETAKEYIRTLACAGFIVLKDLKIFHKTDKIV